LLSRPDLLLLDEPTNHLDAESVDWLERFLKEYPGTVVAITHDRYFLDNVAKWILELDRGRGFPFEGNYSSWLEQKQARLEAEDKQSDNRQRTLQRELEWVKMSPKARQAKGKARLAAYDKLHAEAMAAERGPDKLEINIPAGPRLGDNVIKVENLSKGFGDRLLIEDLSFSLPPAGIVGIIGPNGAGKSTLFAMLTGQQAPDSGTITVGDTVQLSYVDQNRDSLDPAKSVYEEITEGVEHMKVGGREIHGRAYVASFNFKGADQQKLVGDLSGGERNRVHLAKVLKRGGNVLLLDEPTNDLDVDTLRALEDALEQFPGCAVVISHDRWFLDRIATHVLSFEGHSQVIMAPQRTWFCCRTATPHQVQATLSVIAMSLKLIKLTCFGLFLAGLPSIIVSSIRGNNEGWVVTFGMITAVAALVLIAVSAVTSTRRIDAFNDVLAEQVEQRVQQLVSAGADENEVRALLRDTIELTRGQQ